MATTYITIADLKDAGKFVRAAACDPALNGAIAAIIADGDADGSKAKALLALHGITVLNGKRVVFVQDTEEVMHVRVPTHKAMAKYPLPIENSDPHGGSATPPEASNLPNQTRDYPYPHAGVLENYVEGVCVRPDDIDPDFVVDFHQKRLADYTFGHCF